MKNTNLTYSYFVSAVAICTLLGLSIIWSNNKQLDLLTIEIASGDFSNSQEWISGLNDRGIKPNSINSSTENNLYNYLVAYSEQIENFNKNNIFDLEPLKINKVSETINIKKFETIKSEDANLLQGIEYVYESGSHGAQLDFLLRTNLPELDQTSEIVMTTRVITEPINRLEVTGSMPGKNVGLAITDLFQKFKESVNISDYETATKLTNSKAPQNFNSEKAVFSLNQIEFYQREYLELNNIPVGKAIVTTNLCRDTAIIHLGYNVNTSTYHLMSPYTTLENLCTSQYSLGSPITYNDCGEDCFFEPLDKSRSLTSNYRSPELVQIDLPGGGLLREDAYSALLRLSDSLREQGLTLYVTSAYRSTERQEELFSSRVRSNGTNIETAIEAVSKTTAYPGHSEHHLGSTVDVSCQNCSNSALFEFVEENAHKYGYVISYPEGAEHLTGYIHEPWHIRYIGEELATELFESGYLEQSGTYSTELLRGLE